MPQTPLLIRPATLADHKAVCRIAKQSLYTRDYSNMIFSGEACYEAGRVRVVAREEILGFTCFRLRIRDRVMVLYFVGVDVERRGQGVGQILLDDLWKMAEDLVEFKVMKDNPAVAFYQHRGFVNTSEAYDGKAWVMRCSREEYKFKHRAK